MARLIDADEFIKYLGLDDEDAREENLGEIVTLEDFDRQPTAYDVEKVVEELEETEHILLENASGFGCTIGIINSMKKALDIVRKGGV